MEKMYEIDGVGVTQQEYLYGEGVIPPKIPEEVIRGRVKFLTISLEKLSDHSYHTMTYEDYKRRDALFKAVKFWESINDS